MVPITRSLRAGLIALLLVFTAANAGAQTGDIRSTVTDALTGAPLFTTGFTTGDRRVLIDFYTASGDYYGTFTVYETSGTHRGGLPVGTYYVRARATGYISQLHAGISCNAADPATRAYTLDVPACAFYAPRTEYVVGPAATSALMYVFGVCGEWTAESQTPWIHIFSVVNQQTPPIVSGAVVEIDANTGPAARQGTITIGPRAIRFYQAAHGAAPPFGVVDLPADDAVVSGAIAITGWAVAEAGVSQILVYRDPVAGESGLVLVGRATRVRGSRPDVQAVYGLVS